MKEVDDVFCQMLYDLLRIYSNHHLLEARIPTVYKRLPWEAFLIFWDPFTNQNPNRTYRTSLRSFSHLLRSIYKSKSQPYIQDFLEKLFSSFAIHLQIKIPTVHTRLPREAFLIFGIHLQIKSQPYIQDFLGKISSSLGSICKLNLNRTYRTSLRSFHHLLDRFTNQISTVDIRLSWEAFIISEIDLQIRSQP